MLLRRVTLDHFKAFERFTLYLRGDGYLAGPNNAGKSTLIAAIRTGARMIQHAQSRAATTNVLDKGNRVVAHPFAYGRFGLVEENLRHEFRNIEARLQLSFSNGVTLAAVWPPDPQELDPFFYVLDGDVSLQSPVDIRRLLPSIGIVPVLAPVDQQESVLRSPRYVRDNLDGRLASRHFRNQLLLLTDGAHGEDYEAFLDFVDPWLPELRLERVSTRMTGDGLYLDLFFKEGSSRIEKEVFWAGDGLQIWLQILLHIFRLRNHDIIVLDEPDVFLHPDLQRRLVRLLESVGAQTITATHSPELLAEAPAESVVWVDKGRRRSVVTPDSAVLTELMASIGTHFNIRLARALQANRVLFVEGEDMRILRHLATAVGAERLALERDIVVIPLRGYSNWDRIEPFVWLVRDLLRGSVDVFVILDRDYRTDDEVRRVKRRLREIGVTTHVWARKELESYLLEPSILARATGLDEDECHKRLAVASKRFRDYVAEQVGSHRARVAPNEKRAAIRSEAEAEVAELWMHERKRLCLCPPKEILARVNGKLQQDGRKAVTYQRLARVASEHDIADEVRSLLLKVDGARD